MQQNCLQAKSSLPSLAAHLPLGPQAFFASVYVASLQLLLLEAQELRHQQRPQEGEEGEEASSNLCCRSQRFLASFGVALSYVVVVPQADAQPLRRVAPGPAAASRTDQHVGALVASDSAMVAVICS